MEERGPFTVSAPVPWGFWGDVLAIMGSTRQFFNPESTCIAVQQQT